MVQKNVIETDPGQPPNEVEHALSGGSSNQSQIESLTELQRFIDLSRDGALIVQNNTIMALNHGMADMCDYTINELIGRSISEVGETVSGDMGRLADEIQSDRALSIKNQQAELKRRDGEKFPISVNAGQVDFNGAPAALFLVSDHTNTLRIEDELQKARHLESIAALSGGIAHDYNNLLTVIIGNISLIQSYTDSADIIYRLLDEAQEASMVAKSLTQKLITFSRGGLPIKETADMASLLRIVTEFSLSGSNIKCRFDIHDGMALVDIDKTQVSQAVHNLVMNAREAMPKGGVLSVIARNVQNIDGNNGNAPGLWVKISITDQGTGIPPEHLKKIYDPYFSTKERGNQKGTGLGLSICHSIIQRHGGVMEIESEVGKGTAVHIYLRASENPNIERARDKSSPCKTSALESGCGRILVMDDEEMITKMASRLLARLGYETEFARNGSEAVALYRKAMQSDSAFDAVILDLTVRGGMGGEEAVQHLLDIDARAKAIVSSGYSDSPVMNNFAKYGFCGAVVKPYNLKELGQALNRVLT
jgi:PAS domain S-box-containing protein